MAIRDEYQQLDAEIKKEEERSRILDLLSVGVITPDDNYIYFATYAYKEKGLYVDDLLDTISISLDKVFEIIENEDMHFNIDDFPFVDDELINTLESSSFVDMIPKSLNFCIACFDQLFSKLHSAKGGERGNADLLNKISNTKTLCQKLLLLYEEAIEYKTTISIGDIHKYRSQIFYKQFNQNNFDVEITKVEEKQGRKLSSKERDEHCDTIRNRLFYGYIVRPFIALVIYLLLIDDRTKYRPIILKWLLKSTANDSTDEWVTIEFSDSNHTIDEVFSLLTKYPIQIIANVLSYFKDCGIIDFLEYSRIIDAINSSDKNAFISALNSRFADILDTYYLIIKLGYTIVLYYNSQSKKETVISAKHITHLIKKHGFSIPQADTFESIESDDTFISEESARLIFESSVSHIWQIVGLITHYYYKYKHLLLPGDQKCFDRLFSQEPFKYICDQALSDYNKQPNKSIPHLLDWNTSLFGLDHEESLKGVSIDDTNIDKTEAIEEPLQRENIRPNPFGGLNSDAIMVCGNDKKGYVSMFIDYLIYRGYINSENKDAFVCSMCEDLIPKSTLDNLTSNEMNTEGRSNKNIVTLMIARLTNFTANNEIKVDDKVISKGSIYFNKGQIDNGELEEWCLFWPFLTGQNKEGKETFKKLFQSPLRSQDSKMENALKRVTSFIEDYEAAKSQNPSITKLEFIKKRH